MPATADGTMTLTGYTAGTGTINYTYAITAAQTGPNAASTSVNDTSLTIKAHDSVSLVSGATAFNATILDDAPWANATANSVTLPNFNTNIELILDISRSMTTTDGGGGNSRLQVMKNAVSLMLDQYDLLGDVMVRIVSFSTGATDVSGGWVTVATAKTQVNALAVDLYTNYDAGIATAMTAWSSTGKINSAQNVAYFLTDGQPQLSGTTTPPLPDIGAGDETLWKNFLVANQVNAFAYGLGAAAPALYIDPIAYNGITSANTSATLVPDISLLPPILRDSVLAPTSGTLTASGGLGAQFSRNRAAFDVSVQEAWRSADASSTAGSVKERALTLSFGLRVRP